MSERIPVFLLPHSGEAPTDQTAIEELIADSYEDQESAGLRTSTSTNWWHQKLVLVLASAWSLKGLGFLGSETAFLTNREAHAAAESISLLIDNLRNYGFPEIDEAFGPELDALQAADLSTCIDSSIPAHEIDEDTGDAHSFFAFLVSIQQSARDAAARTGGLVWYQPQP